MKEPDWRHCSPQELWEYVAWHLAKQGFDTVLVGGAVVSIYSEGIYQSGDLDFVLMNYEELPKKVLAEIGFKPSGKSFFHPECKHLFIEFVSAPLGIGDDLKIRPREHKIDGQKIKILNPSDCVRDRLASYIYFKARECLDQAVLVASRHKINLSIIRKWCESEGNAETYQTFISLLRKEKKAT